MKKGILIVISAPSGTGKSTLGRELFKEMPELSYSVSMTTRAPRAGEKEGSDYYFVTVPEFEKHRKARAFVEYAHVHGYWYGTPRNLIQKNLDAGVHTLLDIDVQGAKLIKKAYPEAVLVFIAPPSLEVLEQRLRGRHQDDEATIAKRLQNARDELASAPEYDYLIVNNDISQAAGLLKAIVLAEKSRMGRNLERVRQSMKVTA